MKMFSLHIAGATPRHLHLGLPWQMMSSLLRLETRMVSLSFFVL